MIIYLDQNKWIELARMVHGKDTTERAKRVIRDFNVALEGGQVVAPLSAIHYMETARISNAARRSRLGAVMWQYSKGNTLAAYPIIVRHELEVALSRHFPEVRPSTLQLLGRGSSHAFGFPHPTGLLALIEDDVERAMLVGSKELNVEPPYFRNTEHQEKFRNHLLSIESRKKELPKNMWENWLYAMLIVDISKPLHEVSLRHGLSSDAIERLNERGLKAVINDMPTRYLDLHLHKQVLRNPEYAAKITDLEDWSGLGVASCYCDVVVCEKHMADMLQRDGYQTRARIETDLAKTFVSIESI